MDAHDGGVAEPRTACRAAGEVVGGIAGAPALFGFVICERGQSSQITELDVWLSWLSTIFDVLLVHALTVQSKITVKSNSAGRHAVCICSRSYWASMAKGRK